MLAYCMPHWFKANVGILGWKGCNGYPVWITDSHEKYSMKEYIQSPNDENRNISQSVGSYWILRPDAAAGRREAVGCVSIH
jgi:hypothetical protein